MPKSPPTIGRYSLHDEIASGGMATVHLGRLAGPVGFARIVTIKKLHAHYARDPEFAAMFLDEARLAARIRHPNVIPTHDVLSVSGELFLVMEYVQGESLARLVGTVRQDGERIPVDVVSSIVCGALHGLHAAHEATDDRGEPLHIVHRDVSPENLLVGTDGVARVLDFGVAKAVGRLHTTRDGKVKGKLGYMAVEQLRGGTVDRRTDVYSAGVVLWEALTLQRLFVGDNEGATVTNVLERDVVPPSHVVPDLPKALDALTLKALDRNPQRRFQSAREMALALEECVPLASPSRVGSWVELVAGDVLLERTRMIRRVEAAQDDREADSVEPTGTNVSDTPRETSRQPASVSDASVSRLGPPASARRIVASVLLVALAAVAGLAVVWARPRHAESLAVPATSIAETPSPEPFSEVVSQVAPRPAELASASPSAPTPSSPPRPPAKTKTTSRPSRAGAKPCTVTPFVDDAGIRNYARVCD